MLVRISETTYQRLTEGLGTALPVLYIDEHGWKYVEIEEEIVAAVKQYGGDDIDWAINQTINHNQRVGQWPAAKTSKRD